MELREESGMTKLFGLSNWREGEPFVEVGKEDCEWKRFGAES